MRVGGMREGGMREGGIRVQWHDHCLGAAEPDLGDEPTRACAARLAPAGDLETERLSLIRGFDRPTDLCTSDCLYHAASKLNSMDS
jgi:hypothetical protein